MVTNNERPIFNENGKRITSVLEVFLSHVANYPDDLAVQYEDEKTSYKQLNEMANKIAHLLCEKLKKISNGSATADPSRNKIIPICLPRGTAIVASMLAVWKIGLSYSLIEDTDPEARKQFMYDILQADASIVVDQKFMNEVLVCKTTHTQWDSFCERNNLDDIASITWTTGTVGRPKGVLLTHCNMGVNASANFKTQKFSIVIYSHVRAVSYQIAIVVQIYNKNPVYILNDNHTNDIPYLIKYIQEHHIDGTFFPPKFAQQFLESGGDGVLKVITTGSDVVTNLSAKKTIILNVYALTEMGSVTNFLINKSYQNTPIGKPFANSHVYLVDEHGKLITESNVIGEICVAGLALFKGYIQDNLTANASHRNEQKEVFTDNHFPHNSHSQKLFHTKDLAYYDENHNLIFWQRTKFIIKHNGVTIDIPEVERAVCEIEGIKNCVAVGFDYHKISGIKNDIRLYACYVADKKIDEATIHNILTKKIPKYAIPFILEQVLSIPLNDNDKIDRLYIKSTVENNLLNKSSSHKT